jgi:glycosyltransferase involved in cell wall biosynthesis
MRHLVAYPIVLIIVGKGRRTVMDRLKAQVLELNVSRQVYFLGHQPFAKFFSYMRFADVNVIPHKSNAHTDNTVPHKLFEAMMVGKPVLVSSSTPLKRIVSSTNSGLVFQAGSSHDCSEKILELFENKELCHRLGNNGVQATLHGGLNWETTQKSLIDLYRSLVV